MSNNLNGTTDSAVVPYREPDAGIAIPLDMTDIYSYEQMIRTLPTINALNGPYYMQQFLLALDTASSYYSKSMFDLEQAKNRTKEENALAYLERSEDYIKLKGLKSTDETKKQYVQIDSQYKAAKDREDYAKALTIYLGNKVDRFQSAHDDAKKIFDAARDPRGSKGALPSGRDT